jgi:starvation-inducible outer membrane lipoprotein
MKRIAIAAFLAALAACSSLPDSVKGPFARSAQGGTTADTVDQGTNTSAFPAKTDEGKF